MKFKLLTHSLFLSCLLFLASTTAYAQNSRCVDSEYLITAAELAACRADLALATGICPVCSCESSDGSNMESEEAETLCADTLQDYDILSESYTLQKSKLKKAKKRIKTLRKKLRRLK